MTSAITIDRARNLAPAPGPARPWRYQILIDNPETGRTDPLLVPVAEITAVSHFAAAVAHGFPDDAWIDCAADAGGMHRVRSADGRVLGYVAQ